MFAARPLRSQHHSSERGQHHEDLPEVRKSEPGRSQVLRCLRHPPGYATARSRLSPPAGRSGLPRMRHQQPVRRQVLRRLRRRPGTTLCRRGPTAPGPGDPATACSCVDCSSTIHPASTRCAARAGRPAASRCAAGSHRAHTCAGCRHPLRRVRRGHPLLPMLRRAAGRGGPTRVNYTPTFEVSQTSKVFTD